MIFRNYLNNVFNIYAELAAVLFPQAVSEFGSYQIMHIQEIALWCFNMFSRSSARHMTNIKSLSTETPTFVIISGLLADEMGKYLQHKTEVIYSIVCSSRTSWTIYIWVGSRTGSWGGGQLNFRFSLSFNKPEKLLKRGKRFTWYLWKCFTFFNL